MRKSKEYLAWLLMLFVLFTITGCSPKPEYFGVFFVENNELKELKDQPVNFKGNLMSSIVGLEKIPNISFIDKEGYIIFYMKDIPYQSIKLNRLRYQILGEVDNIIGKQLTDVNMWVAGDEIDFKVAPVKGEEGMYRFKPIQPLIDGLYAINFGNIGKQATISAVSKKNVIYPFCMGNVSDKKVKVLKTNSNNRTGWDKKFYPMSIVLDTNKENGLYNPQVLNDIKKFQNFLSKETDVGKTISLVDYLMRINQALHGNDDNLHIIPDNKNLIAQEFLLYENSGDNSLESLCDSKFSKAFIYIEKSNEKNSNMMVDSIIKKINDNDIQEKLSVSICIDRPPKFLNPLKNIRGEDDNLVVSSLNDEK